MEWDPFQTLYVLVMVLIFMPFLTTWNRLPRISWSWSLDDGGYQYSHDDNHDHCSHEDQDRHHCSHDVHHLITILIMIIILMMIVIHSNRPTGHILTDRCQLLPLAINRPIRVCGWAVRVKSKREGRIIQLSETQSTFRWIAKPALRKFTGESCPSCPSCPSCNCLAKFDLFE